MKLARKLIILVIILVSVFALFKFLNIKEKILKQFYPLGYQEYVEEYATQYGVDKFYIYAIIKAESNFNTDANSNSNAKGLMQIMDSTAKDIIAGMGENAEKEYNLYNPKTNIMFGTKYFSDLLKTYNGNVNLALAAYNAGTGNVKKWIDQGTIKKDGSDIENIPFKETNMYLRRITQNYKIYKELYQ